jgi:hypothetical protein
MATDQDTLDLAGDWEIMYGYTYDGAAVTDSSGHHAVRGFPSAINVYRLHFDAAGDGSHGGKKYTGFYVTNPLITLEAETFYDKRGVQQMTMTATNKGEQIFELHCGAHVRYADDPNGVHIVGNWCNGGDALRAREGLGNPRLRCEFTMKKIRPRPRPRG